MNKRKTIMMLPDDLLLNCLARVSRLYHPTLSLASNRFRSLLASAELYQTRTLLGCTESCLYVAIFSTNSSPLRWFTLSRIPNSSQRCLVLVSSPNYPTACSGVVVVVGSDIYSIGGLISRNKASSSVMVMDCRSHTWCEAPNMHVARDSQSACVLHGNIYVSGGSKDIDSTNWMEVFDTKTQTWEFLQTPSEEIFDEGSEYKSVGGYQGTVHVRSKGKNATYKLHKGRWRAADLALNMGWSATSTHCVIDNVLYHYWTRTIEWYDSEDRVWKSLKGLEGLPNLSRCLQIKLVDLGGNLAVLWGELVSLDNRMGKRFWCAEIAIARNLQTRDIWGKLERLDLVSPFHEGCTLVHALACTI